MNRSMLWMPVAVMMITVAPSFAGVATQMWKCELGDGATEEQVMEGARKWLAAAKTVQGGQSTYPQALHPIAEAARIRRAGSGFSEHRESVRPALMDRAQASGSGRRAPRPYRPPRSR